MQPPTLGVQTFLNVLGILAFPSTIISHRGIIPSLSTPSRYGCVCAYAVGIEVSGLPNSIILMPLYFVTPPLVDTMSTIWKTPLQVRSSNSQCTTISQRLRPDGPSKHWVKVPLQPVGPAEEVFRTVQVAEEGLDATVAKTTSRSPVSVSTKSRIPSLPRTFNQYQIPGSSNVMLVVPAA